MQKPVLYLMIPCYNEEKVIRTTAARVTEKLENFIASGSVSPNSRICLLDDGSTDRTWELLNKLFDANDKIILLQHNRNYGEQYANLSGIRYAAEHADVVITMDADLQDDINATDEMLKAYFQGCDVVYGVRKSRKQDRRIQVVTSDLFYRFMRLCGTELVPEHSQYRLMSRKAAQLIAQNTEKRLFLPAYVPLLRLKEDVVYYDRMPRAAGDSHYNVLSLARLASNAILSFGVNVPYFLLALCVLDLLVGFLALFLGRTGAEPQLRNVVMWICFLGAVLLGASFLVARKEMRRHLRAKKRPVNKN